MRRIKSNPIRAEEELAGARQCIVCLYCSVIAASLAALGFAFGIMTTPLILSAVALVLFLMLTGYYACTRS